MAQPSLSSLLAAAKFTTSQTIQNYGAQHFSKITVTLHDEKDLSAVHNIILHSIFGPLLRNMRIIITNSTENNINMSRLFNSLRSSPFLNTLRLEIVEDQEMENTPLELPMVAIPALTTLIITSGTIQLNELISFILSQPQINLLSASNLCILDSDYGSSDEPASTGIWASKVIKERTNIAGVFLDAYSQQIWAPLETCQ